MPDLSALPALDAAIGLAFLFFLLSTVCSAINEGIANVLGWRAKTLEDAIRNLVGDPKVKRGWKEWFGRVDKRRAGGTQTQGLTESVFDHWRIRALARNPESSIRRRRRPSYLPPPAFSLAIAERLAQGPPQTQTEGEQDERTPWEEADEEIFKSLDRTFSKFPGGSREFLQKALANANGTLDGFRVNVEHGFGDAMERASGWYKRKVQFALAVISAVIVIGLNVDTVRVATVLWREAPIRTAVAAQASKQPSAQGAADAAEKVTQLQLPVGWGKNTPNNLLYAIPGWLLTIAALNLGAPFWFDLLSRFARLRGSGVPERPRSLDDTAGTGDVERGSTRARIAAQQAAAPPATEDEGNG
jgi:hypothetical protein